MKINKRKIFILTFIPIVVLAVGYFSIQWHYINTTDDMPYRNLRDFSSGGCMIYFNVKHKGKIYPVVYNNSSMPSRLSRKNKFLTIFSSLYLNEIIKYNWSITVNDTLFSEFKDGIVDEDLIKKYKGYDILSDTSIVVDNHINFKYAGEHYKAIIYTLLKQGINCCINDESGVVLIKNQ